AQNPEVAGAGEIVFPPPGLPIYSSMTLLFKRLVTKNRKNSNSEKYYFKISQNKLSAQGEAKNKFNKPPVSTKLKTSRHCPKPPLFFME
ncbi:hypothetical protein, partial [Azotobacter armeniacus]